MRAWRHPCTANLCPEIDGNQRIRANKRPVLSPASLSPVSRVCAVHFSSVRDCYMTVEYLPRKASNYRRLRKQRVHLLSIASSPKSLKWYIFSATLLISFKWLILFFYSLFSVPLFSTLFTNVAHSCNCCKELTKCECEREQYALKLYTI